jgi:hypothetical protein
MSYAEFAKQKGIELPFLLGGLRPDVAPLLGSSALPAARYAHRYEHEPYRNAVITAPLPVITSDTEFWMDVSSLAVGLQSVIGQRVFEFITGVKPMDEYPEFLAEVRKIGSQKLLELLQANSRTPDRNELFARD